LVSRIKALAEALEGSEVSELDLTEGGTRILIRRRLEAEAPPIARAPSARSARPRRPRPEQAASGTAPDPGVAIIAPLTGVFYASPSPSSASFVEVGQTVQAGQVVCIVEAMKVFNEIKAEISGTVTAMLPKNGQLVQKGDALIRVKPV
jgi:acetyl-CoA carboxylase biotin carboxyl carrier protein